MRADEEARLQTHTAGRNTPSESKGRGHAPDTVLRVRTRPRETARARRTQPPIGQPQVEVLPEDFLEREVGEVALAVAVEDAEGVELGSAREVAADHAHRHDC
eukprot:4929158-Prymnesium_polylepis.1